MILLDAKVKKFFFDRAVVMRAEADATLKALRKAGGQVRLIARRSMRRVKHGRPSQPGKPPNAHRGDLKEKLWFAYDPSARSVVIGPVKHGKGEAPELNEFGGRAVRRRKGKVYTATYPSRPFMAPALAKVTPSLPSRWSNAVKAA